MRTAIAIVLAVSFLGVARADEKEDKATAAFKELEAWAESQTPKTADEKKAFRAEIQKRFQAFLKENPDGGRATNVVRCQLGDLVYKDGMALKPDAAALRTKKLDEALGLFEKVLAAKDDDLKPRAKWGIVQALCGKRDYKNARTRLDAFLKDSPDDEDLKKLDGFLKEVEAGEAFKVGGPAPAIAAKTLAGDELSLAAWKGKVVLVDFWATWCPPCKKELPALKKLYAQLHSKGLEIVGIDGVEKNLDEFKKFLATEKIEWPQIVEDARTISRTYAVKALPRTVLVGKDGSVLAIDLRGEELHAAIKAAVDGKPLPKPKEKPPEKTPTPEPGDE